MDSPTISSTGLSFNPLPPASQARAGVGNEASAATTNALLATLISPSLGGEDSVDATGETPFTASYQFGLQAVQQIASDDTVQSPLPQPQVANQPTVPTEDLNPGQNAPSPLEAVVPAAVFNAADPTTSPFFQTHLGGVLGNPPSALALLNPGAGEAVTDPRVTETYAGVAAKAFTGGQPFNGNLAPLNPETRAGVPPRPSGEALAVGAVVSAYGPQGLRISEIPQVGRVLDLNG